MTKKTCCPNPKKRPSGFFQGLIFGLLPHTFCLLFIILSILGATSASLIFKKFMLNSNFFYYLIALSFLLATISAIVYLYRCHLLSLSGVKKKLGYLLILYGSTIAINLLLFLIIFPLLANRTSGKRIFTQVDQNTQLVTLSVNIPCSGHAPLILEEVKKIPGVNQVTYRFPNLFDINYNPQKTSLEEILEAKIFSSFKAKEIS